MWLYIYDLIQFAAIFLPLEFPFPGIGLRKLVSEYLMKHPVLRARPSDEGKHRKMEADAFSKQARQEVASIVLQQSAKT